MPNVDFDRCVISNRLTQTLNSPDFKRRLLSVKAYLDYEDEHIIRINFLDTLRPELWCLDGLARHLEPLPRKRYGMYLVESLARIPVQFESIPPDTNAWVLYVQVNADQEPLDDAYFLKKVRDQIGFGSISNIDVTLLPGMQHIISIETPTNNNAEVPLTDNTLEEPLSDYTNAEIPTPRRGRCIAPTADSSTPVPLITPPLILARGINTVIVTAVDQRIGTWLFFTLLCNYLDRGYQLNGFATSLSTQDEQQILSKWNPFNFSDQQVEKTLGFKPEPQTFRTALESMHYHLQYEQQTQSWHITPPIFRFDIIHPVDILEDYLVATYYEEARSTSLLSNRAIGSQTKRSEIEDRLIDYMQVYGARQTIGLLLESYENLVYRMCHEAPERLIHLVNAVNKNREYAVDSSLPPLLRNAVHPSAPYPPTAIYLFTETLYQDELKVAHSSWKIGILLIASDHPFNNAHTLSDALCYHLRLDYSLKRSTSPALIPGRQMTIFAAGTPIGQFGEVHPEVLARWELFYPTSFIELDLDTITELWAGTKSGA
jgi:Phenylalanyl tRNA synthetase beta chain CLM domain/tRNA synthetase B5 domain